MTQKVHETKETLYRPQFEHDACGIGAVVNLDGHPTHATVNDALSIVEKLEHRAGKDATGETGDGVGILSQIPHAFFSKDAAAHHLNLGEAGDYGVAMLFFHSLGLKAAQTRKLLETIVEKMMCRSLVGVRFPCVPKFWESAHAIACPISCSCLFADRKMWNAALRLTGDCI